ncbi:LpqB family beta-propeller domain-containing protein [Herbiconiux sp. 11R-BC]|uniref:LpqB family beta-propeller domain-containing protein n=1 Tax=Herbiconiux sp. 11R-BC TaxID=3111637 RepID=UPI003C1038EA
MSERTASARRRAAGGLVMALLLAALAACSGIPQSGPVQPGEAIGSASDIDVIFLAADPTKGATQEQILNGFIQAAKSPQNNYEVARRYLAKPAADTWKPNANTTIDQGTRSMAAQDATTMQMTITPVASVDANGVYAESASSASSTLTFSFTQVDGEWRISQLADGIVIEDAFFDQVFSSHAVYFYDPTFTYLVPDLRWFPTTAAVGTRVVNALLGGPVTWLGDGAVVTAFPDGTTATAVVTTGGQTQVELSSNVLQADAADLQRMQYQLSQSLSDLASATNVTISVDQNAVTIPASSAAPPNPAPRVNAQPLVLRDGAFGYVAGSSVSEIPGVSAAVVALQPASAAYSAVSSLAAVKAANGTVQVVRGGDQPVVLDQRPALIDPAVDPFGYVWSVPQNAPTSVNAYGSDGNALSIPTNWDGAASITSLEISRDGTRALALLSVGGIPKLVVAAVIRNAAGVPQKFGQPVELSTAAGTPIDATWVDQQSVASVTALPSGETRAVVQKLGGRSSSLGSPQNAVAIAGGNDIDGLRVLSSDGSLLQRRGSTWQATVSGITKLAVQN